MRQTKIFIHILLVIFSAFFIVRQVKAEELFYTVQISSYAGPKVALRFFNKLAKGLPPSSTKDLRVEHISSYYAVRAGKYASKAEAAKLLPEIRKYAKSAYVMKAYIIPARIIQAQKTSPSPPSHATVPPQISPNTADKTPEPIEKKAASNDSKQLAPQTVVDKTPKPGSQDFIDFMVNKYLSQKGVSHKDKEANKIKSASFGNTPDCLANGCHAQIISFKNMHSPAQKPQCTACHTLRHDNDHTQTNKHHPTSGSHDFKLSAKGADLCYKCHENKGKGKITHSPIGKNGCLSCHVPHGSDSPGLLLAGSNQFNQQKLCFKCHKNKQLSGKYKHGPVDLGACTFCHDPHSSDFKGLLRENTQALCLNCHEQIGKGLAESKYVHSVLKTKGCVSCHNPHASDFPHLLSDQGEDFCFTCHQDKQDQYLRSKTKHAGLYLEKQCATCHRPHFSKYKNLLNRKEKDLCLTCHGNKSTLPATYKPKNIEKELAGKEDIHAPIQKGECSKCHDPHGSPYSSLLRKEYPKGLYAPFSVKEYAFCFTCHDPKLLAESGKDAVTNFRNGSKNLHFTHVGIDRKGRTCNACHQAHASDGPKLISRSGAPFGAWHMSIDFKLTTTGGSCTPSCHRKMSYDRDKKVDNSVTEKSFGKYYIDYKSKE